VDVEEAVSLWIDGKMTIKEVMVASGVRSLSKLYEAHQEAIFDRLDEENERDFCMKRFVKEMDQAELESEAWSRWSDWLREEPNYLEACVRMLRHERRLQLQEIGRRMTGDRSKV